jgi:hypothetical protein
MKAFSLSIRNGSRPDLLTRLLQQSRMLVSLSQGQKHGRIPPGEKPSVLLEVS